MADPKGAPVCHGNSITRSAGRLGSQSTHLHTCLDGSPLPHAIHHRPGDRLPRWCEQEKWTVAKVITDANRSASRWRTREREGFEEALELIASKEYDAFVTWEPSRAGRELLAYVQLRAACQEAGVLYLTKGRVYDFARHDDSFMMGLEFLSAEKDAAIIRDRQLRTVRLNAQKGRPHGRLPFGYRRSTTSIPVRSFARR